ncbi:MAG: hypothetical protein ACQEXJ_04650 [Myxococcota bacterium]
MQRPPGAKAIAAWAALAILAAAPGARAFPEPKPRHHEGFHLRLGLGGGWQALQAADRSTELRAKGAFLEMDVSAGFSVEDNLILHVTGMYWRMIAPRFTEDGEHPPGADGSASALTVGPGITYYLMPLNLYFTGSLGLGFMFMTRPAGIGPDHDEERSFASDAGWSLRIAVGKEWWIHDDWGLGAVAFLLFSDFREPPDLPRWGGPAFGLGLSATFD